LTLNFIYLNNIKIQRFFIIYKGIKNILFELFNLFNLFNYFTIMNNDSFKLESIVKENISKLDSLTTKITNDYKNSIIDPNNLEEVRKIFKVGYINIKNIIYSFTCGRIKALFQVMQYY
jgi:hypothetical protein